MMGVVTAWVSPHSYMYYSNMVEIAQQSYR